MREVTSQEAGRDIELALRRIAEYGLALSFYENSLREDAPEPCDLSNLWLVKMVFPSGVRLPSADLTGADLTGAYLTDADLTGAYLTDADLTYAKLDGAKLNGANLNGANLNGAKLNGANLSNTRLICVCLTDAALTGANLHNADLYNAKMNGANLTGADLNCADLTGANLYDAKLIGAYLFETTMTRADLTGADLYETGLTLSPGILSANFTNVKNLDTANFFTEDGKRVVGVAVDENGHLAPMPKETAESDAKNSFGDAAQNVVYFADIYPALVGQARERGCLPEETAQKLATRRPEGDAPAPTATR